MTVDRCRHCRSPIPEGSASAPFCCRGCAAVFGLLHELGLGRYYELATEPGAPAPAPEERPSSHGWLEPLAAAAAASRGAGGLCELRLDVQGIHCSACVWLFQETFRRQAGAGAIVVNPALGTVALRYDPARFAVERWLAVVEAFGYRFGPARKQSSKRSVELPLRLGITAALAVNVMLFSVSFYFGLAPSEPEIFRLFSRLSLALATLAVAIGGWPFFRSAVQALRRGVLHLDLPIAVGIALVYATSLARMRGGRGDLAYFDTLAVFITLMLAGRFLQERLIERNRRYLLEDEGADDFVVRRLAGERIETVPARGVAAGDLLLVAPGELVPVDGRILDAGAVSTDWISGESDPAALEAGARVGAGSFNAGRSAFRVAAGTAFADSPLLALLREPGARAAAAPRARGRLWDRLARIWVAAVGTLALAGFLLWLPSGPERALSVAAAILVVTCPCAIGIAIPLAYELVLHRLRRRGAWVRSPDLLDRLPAVRRLFFDKTGTLTLGRLELAEPGALAHLPAAARDCAYDLAVRSAHPVARAVAAELERAGARFDPAADCRESPGEGIETRRPDGLWRLGRAAWAAPGSAAGGTVLAHDGRLVASCATREVARPDARRQLAALRARGYEIDLVSGDAPGRVRALAEALGIAPERAHAGLAPAAKAELVARLDRSDSLYLGDGVNDALAFAAAHAAGTPAIDRPVMPGRSDFFLLGEGLAPLAALLDAGHRLRRVVRRLLGVAVAYNASVVAAALAGAVTPLVAAVVMPASTLTLVALTVAGLERAGRATGEPVPPARPARSTPRGLPAAAEARP